MSKLGDYKLEKEHDYEEVKSFYSIRVWKGKEYIDWGSPHEAVQEAVDVYLGFLELIENMPVPLRSEQIKIDITKPFLIVNTIRKMIVHEMIMVNENAYVKKEAE